MPRILTIACSVVLIGLVSCQKQSLPQNEFVLVKTQNDNGAISYEEYDFGKDYKALWSVGEATDEDWAYGFGEIGFTLSKDNSINDLLLTINNNKFPSLSIGFTDKTTFGGFRLSHTFAADYVLRVRDRSLTELNFDAEKNYRWSIGLTIPVNQIEIKDLQLPTALKVHYENELQAMLQFHNGRKVEDEISPPTTYEMYRNSLLTARFGGDDEEEIENEE